MTTTEPTPTPAAATPPSGRRRLLWRILLVLVGLVLVALALAFVFGPREPVRLTTTFDPAAIGNDPARYLAGEEADVPNLRPEAEKEIVWAYPASRAKTPLAVVYIHGFSASKGETRPLADLVAKELGANLFYTRLAGHGRNAAAMVEPTNRRLDRRFRGSHGDRPADRRTRRRDRHLDRRDARDRGREPARPVARAGGAGGDFPELRPAELALVASHHPVRARPPALSRIGDLWLERNGQPRLDDGYPTAALLPMARLTEVADRLDVSAIRTPALFIYSPRDMTVRPEETQAIAARWGGPHETIEVGDSTDPTQHVIAGDIRSPGTTEPLARQITDWIRRTLGV